MAFSPPLPRGYNASRTRYTGPLARFDLEVLVYDGDLWPRLSVCRIVKGNIELGSLSIALVLLIIAIALLAIDLFVPSGGALAIASGMCGLVSVLFAFRHSFNAGLWFLMFGLASVPIITWVFIKIWPETSVGKRVRIGLPEQQIYSWSAGSIEDIRSLVGQMGVVHVELIPTGMIEIEGIRLEARTDGEPIPHGTRVRVLRIDMGVLVVAPIHDSSLAASKRHPPIKTPRADQDLLDRPVEEFGIESLDDETSSSSFPPNK